MRYGVQYQPLSGTIAAGAVRRDQKMNRDVFITKDDITGQAIVAVALWLIAHDDGMPYEITATGGIVYELTARIIPPSQALGFSHLTD